MSVRVKVEWHAATEPKSGWPRGRKPTIYEVLRNKLGREPTHEELTADVRRIFAESTAELAARGKLSHQRKR